MAARKIKKRARFFLAVEGESEQSFVRWLQMLADERLAVYLESYPLNGGGYKSMLENAVHWHGKQSRSKGPYRERFLLVDADRAGGHDWTVEKLREEAARHKFVLVLQRPNHEGLLYRMTPNKERDVPTAATAVTKLKAFWPTYQKPSNAQVLNAHYSLNDLVRVAGVDLDLGELLRRIGLI